MRANGIVNGIVNAIVTNLEDPENLGRVRVKYPTLDIESSWARMATPMAGPDRGVHFLPEVEDEVLVAFAHGDIRFPYILGCMWNKQDTKPATDGDIKKNNWRFIKSRSGHIIKLDDTDGKETIELIDKADKHKIIIDCAGDKIQILCDSGDVEVNASGTVKVEASTIEIKSSGNMTLEAGGNLTLEASGSATLKGATVEVSGSGPVKVAGTPIQLN